MTGAIAVKPVREPKEKDDPELGRVRYCQKCDEWWPATREFFYSRGGHKLHSWCRACCQEWRQARRRQRGGAKLRAGDYQSPAPHGQVEGSQQKGEP
jgi:hypothetical protein